MQAKEWARWRWAMFTLGALYAAAVLYVLPFATNDGPVHLSFAHLLGATPDALDLQARHYQRAATLNPNLAVYALLVPLLRAGTPEWAEAVVQLACLLGPVGATVALLSQFQRRQLWVALFAFPLGLHQLFFLGLYNYCLSLSGFLLSLAALLWMQKRPGAWRAAVPVAALYFTWSAHAAGFLATMLGLFVLAAVPVAGAALHGGVPAGWRALLRRRRHMAVLLSPLPLLVSILLSGGGAPGAAMLFGAALDQRLRSFALLHLLNLYHTPLDRYLAAALAAAILAGVALLAASLALAYGRSGEGGMGGGSGDGAGDGGAGSPAWRRRHGLPGAAGSNDARAATALLLFLALLALALAFPDTLGGGWTHYKRMQMFPYFAGLLCMACLRLPSGARHALAALAVAASLVLIAGGTWRQHRIKQQLAPLAQLDKLVGRHCTVLPLVLDDGGAWAGGMAFPLKYRPFFHAASRLELRGDRLALFNYLARLDVYPVRFVPGQDQQALLFHWLPQQQDTALTRIDIGRYERSSGHAVDYVLQWGALASAAQPLRDEVRRALQDYQQVYAASDGTVLLYRRHGPPAAERPASFRSASRCTSRALAALGRRGWPDV